MARQAQRRGPAGAEAFAAELDRYFCAVIDACRARGGIIGGMVGDALTAFWPDGEGAQAVCNAIAAAQICHDSMPMGLTCRISLARGDVALSRHQPPGDGEVWLLSGSAPLRAALLNAQTPAGRTMLEPDLAAAAQASGLSLDAVIADWDDQPQLVAQGQPVWSGAPAPASEIWPFPRHDRAPLSLVWQDATSRLALSEAGNAFFRDLTILSIDLSEGAGPAGLSPEQLDMRLQAVLAEIELWQGLAINVLAEEKGVILHAAFGLPPAGPEKRVVRAVDAALNLRRSEKTRDMPIGVASGRMFVAALGSGPVRAVSAFGWPSALATRLMQRQGDTVLVDEATGAAVSEQFDLAPETIDDLKGARGPVHAARVLRRWRSAASKAPIALPDSLAALLNPETSTRSLTVRGASGLGKSRLCAAATEAARAGGWIAVQTVPRPGAITQPLAGLNRVIRALDPEAQPAAEAQQTAANLATQLDLFSRRATSPILVVIDDAQTLDRESAELLIQASARRSLRLILSAPTEADIAPTEAEVLLTPFRAEDARSFICAQTKTANCEPEALGLLMERTGGNPLHLRELVEAMLGDGSLIDEGGALRLVTDGSGSLSVGASEASGLRDLALSRLDALPSEQRAILSIAAVLGEPFDSDDIASLSELAVKDVSDGIATLKGAGLLETSPTGRAFVPSAVIREVAYEALPYRTRAGLHLRIAERGTAGDLAQEARHWAGAGQLAEAITCHERMAQDAVKAHAYGTAIAHAAQARRLAADAGDQVSRARLQKLALIEGTAALEDVELAHARQCLTDLLADLDVTIPEGTRGCDFHRFGSAVAPPDPRAPHHPGRANGDERAGPQAPGRDRLFRWGNRSGFAPHPSIAE
ncbi:hypothetical protein POI8812_03249 [Pontivivens insulae]|uniref:Orc1-like AAA ATPase domain-containing protein n=1 Tax=Pontivivens insulae TaxID=1639689 RepID=A0A2R8AF74_9RHOB|nr:hypothetical protein POI8812_03249 [Pontivivens insulae]